MKLRDEEREGVSQAANRGHEPTDQTAYPGMAAARKAAIIREGLGKSHADAGTNGRGQSHEECSVSIPTGKGSGEYWSKSGDGAIHQAGEAGLHNLEHEKATVGFLLLG